MNRIDHYFDDHLATITALRPQADLIARVGTILSERLHAGGCVFWCGNGGSAADSQHLAAELVGRFERERRGLASVALTTDTSALTAIANDCGFDQVFSRQVEALCRPGDVLIGISTSGNSPNVLRAVRAAREMGVQTIGLAGKDGGELRAAADLCIVVPSPNTARIQEAHILIGHILCGIVEDGLAAAGTGGA